jgi:catechol 2,3-dioxygenase-like lactoylglutathione lyase family enzyme
MVKPASILPNVLKVLKNGTSSGSLPLIWGQAWKHCTEYKVSDFAAEVGFFIDVLGFQVNAFNPGYAMFTSPQEEFYFAVIPALAGDQPTPCDAIRLQFMVKDALSTTRELENRGIVFDQLLQPIQPGSSLLISAFRTPNGITVEVWGVTDPPSPLGEGLAASNLKINADDEDEEDDLLDDEEDDDLEDDELIEDDDGELVEDEDSDVDETGLALEDEDADDEEEADEDEEELPFEDDESEDDDLDDFDLDDDEFELDEEDDEDEFEA